MSDVVEIVVVEIDVVVIVVTVKEVPCQNPNASDGNLCIEGSKCEGTRLLWIPFDTKKDRPTSRQRNL